MRLEAQVKHVVIRGIHKIAVASSSNGKPVFEDMPDAVRVIIEVGENGTCMLIRYGKDGTFCGDTWHETLENAKAQARQEYHIDDADWWEMAG